MSAKITHVGSYAFPSRQAAFDFCRERLLKHGHRILEGEDAALARDLFSAHPNSREMAGPGVVRFEVGSGMYNTTCLYVVRRDGARQDFSIHHAIYGFDQRK